MRVFLIALIPLFISCAVQNTGLTTKTYQEYLYYDEMVVNPKANHVGIETIVVVGDGPSIWQGVLIGSGYNTVDRSKIESIINEQAIYMAGLSKEAQSIKAGELVGADAILLTKSSRESYMNIVYKIEEAKLISIGTGEVLFIANLDKERNYKFDPDLSSVIRGIAMWREGIFDQYRNRLADDIPTGEL